MDAATAGAIATIIGALAAVIRWLLQVWAKQSAEIERIRESVLNRTISQLEAAVEDHKKVLNTTTLELKALHEQMSKVAGVGIRVGEKWTDLSSRLELYVAQNQKNIDKLHGEIVTLGRDLILLKGTLNAKKGNQ